MFWMKIIGTFIKVLKDGATPNQIAAGFTLGFALGLIPGWPLQAIGLLFLIVLLNVNISMAFAGALLAKLTAFLLDPWLDSLGNWALSLESLHGVYTTGFNNSFLMLSRFNNTLVMGAMVVMVVLFLPLFFGLRVGVVAFRERVQPWMEKLRVVQLFQGSKFYGWYERVSQFGFW
ncbi:MAG: TIGR03546 family protein [Deltaproteobacteria bacterium]|nr:TIGR03546 family protein [Deltaproteobacteria bacterium]